MSRFVLPPITAMIVDLLRADREVVGYCSQQVPVGLPPRIAAFFPEIDDPNRQWKMPHYAIIVRRVGGPGADIELGTRLARFDIICYGPGATSSIQTRNADELWRTVDPVLSPPPMQGISESHHIRNAEIIGISSEADPIPGIEPGTNWRRLIAPYLVEYMPLPVSTTAHQGTAVLDSAGKQLVDANGANLVF